MEYNIKAPKNGKKNEYTVVILSIPIFWKKNGQKPISDGVFYGINIRAKKKFELGILLQRKKCFVITNVDFFYDLTFTVLIQKDN